MEATTKSNLRPLSLELGGKSPITIFDVVELDMAEDLARGATFFNKEDIVINWQAQPYSLGKLGTQITRGQILRKRRRIKWHITCSSLRMSLICGHNMWTSLKLHHVTQLHIMRMHVRWMHVVRTTSRTRCATQMSSSSIFRALLSQKKKIQFPFRSSPMTLTSNHFWKEKDECLASRFWQEAWIESETLH